MLSEQTLFGSVDLVQKSIDRLREFEKFAIDMHPDGYWVAFSGGKDSIVLLDLVRRSGVRHTVHFNVTTVDPPELVQFIRANYPDVKFERPEMSMWALIPKNRYPPMRNAPYCCGYLKERGGIGRFTATGIRWAESTHRSKRGMVESCYRNKTKRYLHPIIEWSDVNIWQYIRQNNMPYCRLYDEGFTRIGCIGCPNAGRRGRLIHFARWPKYEKAYRKAFDKMAAENQRLGWKKQWANGDEVFDWWMQDRHEKVDPDQGILFE